MTPMAVILGLWAAWLASWMLAWVWSKRTVARPVRGSERLYSIMTLAGWALLFAASIGHISLFPPLLRLAAPLQWVAAALALAGLGFCWWARICLGRNWSWEVTRKEDHQMVYAGPYGFVRHPIYTGLIIAAAATALLIGKAPSFAGLGLIIAGLWIKARLEERFLSTQLGGKAYADYARRTGMLLPGL
jgi:protein-S-isoprenylcysteine O-methyltransferase Ste14